MGGGNLISEERVMKMTIVFENILNLPFFSFVFSHLGRGGNIALKSRVWGGGSPFP